MKYKKVFICSLPKQDLTNPPAAAPVLAALCKANDVEYDIFDFNLHLYNSFNNKTDWEKLDNNWTTLDPYKNKNTEWYQHYLSQVDFLIDKIYTSNCDLITFSCFTDYAAWCALGILEALYKTPTYTRNKIQVVIGGTGIRSKMNGLFGSEEFCSHALKSKLIEYFIYGEAEESFQLLLKGETVFPGINNLNFKQLTDLDQYPYPEYSKINIADYPYADHASLVVTGSKGCVRKCTYCDVAKYWPKYTYKSGIKVANEMYYLFKTTGIARFEFSDSLINGSLKQFKEMNKQLIKLQTDDPLFKVSYKGQYIVRPKNQFHEQDYKEMKMAGCIYIYPGIESFSDRLRYEMDKKFLNEDIDFHLEMCGKYHIPNTFLMLVGYPTETIEDHNENLAYLKKYQKYAQAGIITLIDFGFTVNIMPDTPLYNQQAELEIIREFHGHDELEANWVSLKNPKLGLKERVRRWTELVEIGFSLGYRQPRIASHSNLLYERLLITKNKSKLPRPSLATQTKLKIIPIIGSHIKNKI